MINGEKFELPSSGLAEDIHSEIPENFSPVVKTAWHAGRNPGGSGSSEPVSA